MPQVVFRVAVGPLSSFTESLDFVQNLQSHHGSLSVVRGTAPSYLADPDGLVSGFHPLV